MNQNLQSGIDNITKLTDIDKLNLLLEKCVLEYEMTAVVYIFDYMKENKYKPNELTYSLINKLHGKTIKEQSKLIIPDNGKKKLEPRRRIHKIMKGYDYSKALKHKQIVIDYLNNNQYVYDGKNNKQKKLLINKIKTHCKISLSDVKFIITYLNRQKFFISK